MSYCPTCRGRFENGQFCPKDGTRLQAEQDASDGATQDRLIGQVVADRFTVVSLLGKGGMGTVYEAEHRYIRKRVALKLLNAEITEKPDALARFQREALAASTIGHENIVQIDDFGRLADGQVYLTMEYLDGLPLNRVIGESTLSPAEVIDVAIQTCHGLAAAHAKGIIHRDMKPENIFLVEDGRRVKILDFGIAKVTRADTNTNLTKTGAIFGTPNYMAPEQALGKTVDHRADIYAVGVILYELLTGRVPFRSDSFLAILTQHVTKDPTPPREAAPERPISAALEALVLRAMAKNPDDRFQDMGEMVAALLEVRGAELGDRPLASHLRLSRIMPPSSAALTPDELPPLITGPGQVDQGKVTATAGELVEALGPPRRRAGLFIGLGLVAVVLGGAGVAAVVHLGRAGRATPDPSAALGGRGAGQGRGGAVTPTTPPAVQPLAKAGVAQLVVITSPTGATITVEGKVTGTTPKTVELTVGSKSYVGLSLEGYHPAGFSFTADREGAVIREVPLKPRRVPRRKPPRRSSRPARAKPELTRPRPEPAPRMSDHGEEPSSHDRSRDPSSSGSSHGDD